MSLEALSRELTELVKRARAFLNSVTADLATLNGLAATVGAFNHEVRQRSGVSVPLLTDGNGETEPVALPAGKKRR